MGRRGPRELQDPLATPTAVPDDVDDVRGGWEIRWRTEELDAADQAGPAYDASGIFSLLLSGLVIVGPQHHVAVNQGSDLRRREVFERKAGNTEFSSDVRLGLALKSKCKPN